jgi:hypothetical protein
MAVEEERIIRIDEYQRESKNIFECPIKILHDYGWLTVGHGSKYHGDKEYSLDKKQGNNNSPDGPVHMSLSKLTDYFFRKTLIPF